MTALTDKDLQLLKEKVEVLNGDRRGAADKAAFRIGDIKATQELVASLRAGAGVLEKRLTDLTTQAQSLTAQLGTVQNGLDAAIQQLAALGSALSAASSHTGQEITALNGTVSSIQTALDATSSGTASARARLDQITADATAMTIGTQASAPAAASPPTKAEFDQAVDDITELFSTVSDIKTILVG